MIRDGFFHEQLIWKHFGECVYIVVEGTCSRCLPSGGAKNCPLPSASPRTRERSQRRSRGEGRGHEIFLGRHEGAQCCGRGRDAQGPHFRELVARREVIPIALLEAAPAAGVVRLHTYAQARIPQVCGLAATASGFVLASSAVRPAGQQAVLSHSAHSLRREGLQLRMAAATELTGTTHTRHTTPLVGLTHEALRVRQDAGDGERTQEGTRKRQPATGGVLARA